MLEVVKWAVIVTGGLAVGVLLILIGGKLIDWFLGPMEF